jgi:ribose-phosphate pyrophosphokinase
VANLLTEAGATRVVLMDIHSLQTIGYYDIPVDHIAGESVILDYLTSKDFAHDEIVIVSPDVGGVPRARAFAKKLNDAPLAIIDKRRTGHNKAQVMNLIGEVDGKVAILLDDMIDTGGTLLAGAELLRKQGAREVYACATHAVFSPARHRALVRQRLHRGHRHQLDPAHTGTRFPAINRAQRR